MDPWFAIADREDLSYDEKLAEYRRLADGHFDADRYAEFCATSMAGFDEAVVEYVESADFDQLIVDTVRTTFPAHEHDHFIAHYRGLLGVAPLGRALLPIGLPPPAARNLYGHSLSGSLRRLAAGFAGASPGPGFLWRGTFAH